MPLFSVLSAYYQGAVTKEEFFRGVDCIKNQIFQDYEFLVYHDGPLLDKSFDLTIPVKETEIRYNDFGNSLRDLGIHEAKGKYILHFNIDNILYPNALEEIAKEINRPPILPIDFDNIIIFPILYRGWININGLRFLDKSLSQEKYTIFTGFPPVHSNIDAMQLVMKRELWLKEGGWYDKSSEGDGLMYQKFASQYGYRTVGPILGEHW